MKSIQNKVLAFLYTNTPQIWREFFRIAIGTLIFTHFIAILPDFDLIYSTTGLIASDIRDVYVPEFMVTLPKIILFINNKGISEDIVLFIFKTSYIVATIALVFGVFPRLNACILLFLQISLVKGSELFSYGIDYFTSMSLLYLILMPSGKINFSFKKIKKKDIYSYYTPFLRLFQVHLSISYFFSGFTKILGFNWRSGESVWKAINLPYSNLDFNFDFYSYGEFSSLFLILGWSTIIIEMLYPLFIWIGKTRKIWLYLTISMHIGIAIILNLYYFSALMIIWNLTAFHFPFIKKTSSIDFNFKNN